MPTWNAAITTAIQALDPGFVRQRLFHGNTQFLQMVDALTPRTKFLGAAGQLSDNETDVRAEIAAWRGDARSKNLVAILGPNEPNGNSTGFSAGGPGNTVRQQYWIWDEVVNGGTWTHRDGSARPLVIGPALKRAGFTDEVHQYDDDIAALAAATYNPGSGALHLADVVDGLDHHHYDGSNGPGARVSDRDGYNQVIPGITLGADGKCSLFTREKARINQTAPGKPVLYWTEWGWTGADGSPSEAQRALYAQESYLRAYLAGVSTSIYETVDEYPLYGTREDYFGIFRLADNPHGIAGPKPAYTAIQTLLHYTGSASFTGIGWVEPLAGVNPDCGVVALSKAAGGWDVYMLREGVASVDFVTAPGHAVTGASPTSTDSWGNKHYTTSLASPMTVLAVT